MVAPFIVIFGKKITMAKSVKASEVTLAEFRKLVLKGIPGVRYAAQSCP
jgi:hypothetical protein